MPPAFAIGHPIPSTSLQTSERSHHDSPRGIRATRRLVLFFDRSQWQDIIADSDVKQCEAS